MLTASQRDQILDHLDQAGVTDVYFWRENLVVINDYDCAAVEGILAGLPAGAGINLILDSAAQDQLVAH